MKKNYLFTILCMLTTLFVNGQQTVEWRDNPNGADSGNWFGDTGCNSIGTNQSNWTYPGFGGNSARDQPNCGDGSTDRHFINFSNNHETSMTVGSDLSICQLLFQTGASTSRTITGSTITIANTNTNTPKIENYSNVLHTINSNITIDFSAGEINPINGDLTITGAINNNGNLINVWGDNGNSLIISGDISGGGGFSINQNSILTLSGNNTYSGTTTVSSGTLVLNSSISSSAVTVESGATLQISSNSTVSSLTINSGGKVTVDSGITLTISNDLTLNSGSSMVVEETGSVSVTGNAKFSRNLTTGSQWYLMSSPVSGETYDAAWATANSIPTSGLNTDNIGVSTYDNSSLDTADGGSDTATGHWRYLQTDDSNSSTFNESQGYGIIRSGGSDITFTGTSIYSADQTIGLTLGVNNFNLVGNPFTGSLNLGDFFTDNGASVIAGSQTWFWNGSSYDVKTSGDDGAFEIAPGQGFFVEAAAATNLTFDIADVSHTASTFQKTTPKTEIRLILSEGTNNRNAYVRYNNSSTTDYDLGHEGNLFGGVEHNLAIYTQLVTNNQGEKYQVQSLPNSDHENMIVPIGVIANAGEITFSAESLNLPIGLKVFLEDRNTNTFARLDEANSSYKVTLTEKTDDIGRFYLHTNSAALSTETVALENVSVYNTDKSTLRIVGLSQGKSTIRMFNVLGKQVLNSTFTSNGVSEINVSQLSTGIYIVQLENENGSLNKKIVLE